MELIVEIAIFINRLLLNDVGVLYHAIQNNMSNYLYLKCSIHMKFYLSNRAVSLA